MFQTKVVQKIKTQFYFQSFFENFAVFETMWKNIEKPGRSQMTKRRMRIACWITKATDTHSDYVILIVFQLQQWLREFDSMLRYTYIACLVHCCSLVL